MKFGNAAWGFRETPLEQQLKITSDMGLRVLELGIENAPNDVKIGDDTKAVKELYRKYGIELMKKWQVLVETCEKGMGEVWQKYEGYSTDYSHGWGATPTYQLPSKLLGIEILEPGFKKIRLNPNLYRLEWAEIKVPTPYGELYYHMVQGKPDKVDIPKGIEVDK